MARELTINIWCDPCHAEDVREQAVGEYTITILGVMQSKARLVALCERHKKELFDPIVELINEHSALPDSAAKPAPKQPAKSAAARPASDRPGAEKGKFPCPACEGVMSTYQSLAVHARHMHDTTLSVLEGRESADFVCTQPGCGKAYTKPQHLGRHLSQIHGIAPAKKAG